MTDLTIKQVDGFYIVHDGDKPVSAPVLSLQAAEKMQTLLQAKRASHL